MTNEEQIAETEAKVQAALEAYFKAQQMRDPLINQKELELVRLQTELNALKMRRAV